MNCPLCRSEAQEVLHRIEGFKAGRFYDIYECQGCLSSFCSPLEADTEIYKEIYRSRETIVGYNRYHAYYLAVKDQVSPLDFLAKSEECYWFIADYLENHIIKHAARLLEVGSGLGYLTFSLHKSGYKVRGVELSTVAVADATSRFGALYQCKDALTLVDEGERFDVILLTEVIEHIIEPSRFIQQLSLLLNPGGVILVTTPNKGFAANNASRWLTDLPPVHLWWFTKDGLKHIAESAGMSVSFYGFHEWHKYNFPRQLLKPAQNLIPEPRVKEDGSPAHQDNVILRKKRLTKKLLSLLRYALYRHRFDLDDSVIIGAIFSKR